MYEKDQRHMKGSRLSSAPLQPANPLTKSSLLSYLKISLIYCRPSNKKKLIKIEKMMLLRGKIKI